MKFSKVAVASAALLAAVGAHATLVTTLGGNTDPTTFLAISSGAIGGNALVGGTVLSATTPTEIRPSGAVGTNYLSVEGSQSATLTFAMPTTYLSFLWGSPDSYNSLVVTEADGTVTTLSAMSFGLTTGANAPESYVQIMDTASAILSLTYSNSPKTNSFETANYSVTPVPEPETYALMLGGLGLVGFMARRRRG
jgi:hypothetical protein